LTGDKIKDDKERRKYRDAIMRTRKEIKDGKFHYPAIVDYIKGIGTVQDGQRTTIAIKHMLY